MAANELYDVHILFALIGGAVGASKAFFKQRDDSTIEKVVNFVIGLILSVSLTDISFRSYDLGVYGYMGVGMIWGLIGMYLIEAIQNLAPAITNKFLKGKLKNFLGIDLDSDEDKGK